MSPVIAVYVKIKLTKKFRMFRRKYIFLGSVFPLFFGFRGLFNALALHKKLVVPNQKTK